MSTRAATIISRGIIVACIAMVVADVVLLTAAENRTQRGEIVVVGDPTGPGMAEVRAEIQERLTAGGDLAGINPLEPVLFGGIALIWVITGSVIVSRQPRNLAGWIFCLVAASVPLNGLAFGYTVFGVRFADNPLPAQGLVAVLGEYSFASVALIPLLFLLFPDGRPPSPKWSWAVRLLVVGFCLALGAFALQPGPLNNFVDSGILYENPFGIAAFANGEPGALLVPIGVVTMLATFLATVVAVRQRFRRAVGEERQQMRWLVAVATAVGVGLILILLLATVASLLGLEDEGAGGGPDPFDLVFSITALTIFVGIPVAYLVSIFRYGLWELDVVLKKAAVAIVVAALLTIAAVGVIGGLGVLAIGGGDVTRAAVWLVLGLLVVPVTRLARRVGNRLAYGRRATPYEVLTVFGERVGETYSTEDVLPRMAQVLALAVGATAVRVWVRVGNQLRPEASWPASGEEPEPIRVEGDVPASAWTPNAVEVRHQGELLGAFTMECPASDPMNPAKERLARDLASQAGLVLRNVRLIEELRASRQRLVAAQDEERRKLERDLHDGAQQQLVALAVQLKLARTMLDRDPAAAGPMLDGLQSSAGSALEELRDLARGIYPPLLADKGLPAALEAQARKAPQPVTVETDGIGRYPQEVEAAVYFCTLEALNNVAKYAKATTATVRLDQREGILTFEISDDGVGFDPEAGGRGTGLQGMADRLDAIGGLLEVDAAPGSGTTVRGRIRADGRPS